MNLLEAIQGAGENWFRPVGMTKEALSYNGSVMLIVHQATNSGFKSWVYNLNNKEELTGEWEIVTPEQVLSERKL